MSEFGLIEMTRQRSRESLSQTIYTNCPYCAGTGLIKSHESMSIEIERSLKKILASNLDFELKLVTHPELNRYLEQGDKSFYIKLATKANARIEFAVNDNLHLNEYAFYSTINGQKIET
jgi:ribonuclease G